jgi:hypothetical protein
MRVCSASLSPPEAINVTNYFPASTVSTLTPTASSFPQLKKIRHTSCGAQQNHANKLKIKLHHKAAHKRATSLYASKLAKPEHEKKMSASEVSKLVFSEFGVEIDIRTIQREVAED